MRHDEIAADLARKLEKAHGPHGSRRLQVIDEAACEMALWKCAPLLLSERAALRAVEDAARVARANVIHGPSCTASKMGPDYAADCTCGLGAVVAALSALDAAREEA